jgi:hypothetical protein
VETARRQDDGKGNPADRRREPRRSATGKVHLRFESGLACSLDVDLLDVSDSGFRAMHRHGLLPLGANAIFRHPHAFGIARVVWNWMNGDDVETGFVIMR